MEDTNPINQFTADDPWGWGNRCKHDQKGLNDERAAKRKCKVKESCCCNQQPDPWGKWYEQPYKPKRKYGERQQQRRYG